MSDNSDVDTNLEDFEKSFFTPQDADEKADEPAKEDPETPEVEVEVADDDSDDDAIANEISEDEPEAEDKSKLKLRKKKTFQDRIDELTKRLRETERQLEEQKTQKVSDPVVKPKDPTEPTSDDKNEDGSDKYPLGEFDPQYIKDLAKFSITQEKKTLKEEMEAETARKAAELEFQTISREWETKLAKAEERIPDIRDKGQELEEVFRSLDQPYAEYLAHTIMTLEYGPDVLNYLSENISEARAIVSGDPRKATLALGRLEARFALEVEKDKKPRSRLTSAPPPPPTASRGTGTKIEVPDDTDDLDAFSAKFFK